MSSSLICAGLLVAITLSFSQNGFALDGKLWHHDMYKAHQRAVEEDKPMLIVFGASWCRYCKKLEKETLGDPGMSQYIDQNFIPVHLDLDEEKKIGKILEVKSLPCTVVLSPNADLLGKIVGYKNVEAMHKQLQKTLRTQSVLRQASQNSRSLK